MKAEASKVTVAVATVVIFGTVAIFLYPAIYPLMSLWFSPKLSVSTLVLLCTKWRRWLPPVMRVSPDAENAAVIAQNAARDDAGSVPHPAGGAC